jgi:2-polyprenyl-3-methyl-5-hydroxy-6-metoxy-1,4-benzoquinol methylase
MKEKLIAIKNIVEELLAEVEKTVEKTVEKQGTQQDAKQEPKNKLSPEFEVLKQLLESETWPEAVFAAQIADENSEKDKEERAEGICDILLPPLEGKRFLDFGCGEGHSAKYMASNCDFSVGYDIEKNPRSQFTWEENQDKYLLTVDFEKVKQNGPYDAILLYDVLDHAQKESPSELLKKAKSVLKQDGKIFVRCHPWSSRHGGHAYRKLNKAFVHLVFKPEELVELGLGDLEFNHKFVYPIAAYNKIVEEAGLNKSQQEIDSQEVEPFFKNNALIRQRILSVFEISDWKPECPAFQMSQCFVDFVLTHKK